MNPFRAKETQEEKSTKKEQEAASADWWEAIKAAEAKVYAELTALKASMTEEEWEARAAEKSAQATEETAKLDNTIYTR